ncbi:MAG: MerR family DNA-binding transcriptional regulator [Alphaproteobacteria bacterium]|nr:MerR family DNA-binding transcriptional regulator [Alphaproteobacteria bacterium]MCB9698836.1 MerR family DNA-binding transcriptional regulator [Alphaproteobacteria bacterium]
MPRWLTIAEAAREAGVSTATLRRWDREGRVRAVRHPVSGYRLYASDRLASLLPRDEAGDARTAPGRERELAAVRKLSARRRAVVITGVPGIGKTHLLEALTTDRVACERLTDAAALREATARTLGVPLGRLETRLSTVRVLGLDHLPPREDVLEQVATWLSAHPGLRVVATSSRDVALPDGERFELGPLSPEAGARLFLEHAAPGWPDDRVTALVTRLEGHPLALKLAAAQTTVLGPDELIARWSADLVGEDGEDERHRTLRTAVGAALEGCTEDERAVLTSLAVFQGRFDVAAAEAVCDRPAPQTLAALRGLRRTSLLRTHAGPRALHELWGVVRDALPEPTPALRARHARWLATTLRATPEAGQRELGADFRAVLADEELPAALRADVIAASWPLVFAQPLEQVLSVVDGLCRALDGEARLRMVRVRGVLRTENGQLELSRQDLEEARTSADPAIGADAASDLAMIKLRSDGVDAAERLAREARDALQAAGHERLASRATTVLANIHLARGDRRAAVEALSEVVRLGRRMGDPSTELSAAAVLVRTEVALGSATLDEALRVVGLARELGPARFEGYGLETVGYLLLDQGHADRAVASLHEGAEVCRAAGQGAQADRTSVPLVLALLEAGRPAEASELAERLAVAFESLTPLADCTDGLRALCARATGDLERTRRLATRPTRSELTHAVRVALELGEPEEPLDLENPLVRSVLRLTRRPDALQVAPDGSWFETPGTGRVDLSGRPVLAAVLAALHRTDRPVAAADLVATTWPDERLVGDSGLRRLRSAIWGLRKLGLGDHLVTTADGYRLR